MIPHGTISAAAFSNAGLFLDTRSDLVKQIEKLESDSEALGRVRATIAVNFSPERATDGIIIEKHPSVLHMMIQVIEAYKKRLTAYQDAVNEIETERIRLQQMYDERPGMVEHRAAETILDALDLLKKELA